MEIRQHVPGCVETSAEPWRRTFESLDELLNLKEVKRWGEEIHDGLPFWQYSESEHGNEWILLAEWKNEEQHRWRVIGYMSGSVGLPVFEGS